MHLSKSANPLSQLWIIVTLMALLPGAIGVAMFWRVRKLAAGSPREGEIVESLFLNLLILLFVTYFFVDVLLISLASMTR